MFRTVVLSELPSGDIILLAIDTSLIRFSWSCLPILPAYPDACLPGCLPAMAHVCSHTPWETMPDNRIPSHRVRGHSRGTALQRPGQLPSGACHHQSCRCGHRVGSLRFEWTASHRVWQCVSRCSGEWENVRQCTAHVLKNNEPIVHRSFAENLRHRTCPSSNRPHAVPPDLKQCAQHFVSGFAEVLPRFALFSKNDDMNEANRRGHWDWGGDLPGPRGAPLPHQSRRRNTKRGGRPRPLPQSRHGPFGPRAAVPVGPSSHAHSPCADLWGGGGSTGAPSGPEMYYHRGGAARRSKSAPRMHVLVRSAVLTADGIEPLSSIGSLFKISRVFPAKDSWPSFHYIKKRGGRGGSETQKFVYQK